MILGEGEGFDFWVPEKREELRDLVLVLVFRRELGFVLGRKSFFFFFNIYIYLLMLKMWELQILRGKL